MGYREENWFQQQRPEDHQQIIQGTEAAKRRDNFVSQLREAGASSEVVGAVNVLPIEGVNRLEAALKTPAALAKLRSNTTIKTQVLTLLSEMAEIWEANQTGPKEEITQARERGMQARVEKIAALLR